MKYPCRPLLAFLEAAVSKARIFKQLFLNLQPILKSFQYMKTDQLHEANFTALYQLKEILLRCTHLHPFSFLALKAQPFIVLKEQIIKTGRLLQPDHFDEDVVKKLFPDFPFFPIVDQPNFRELEDTLLAVFYLPIDDQLYLKYLDAASKMLDADPAFLIQSLLSSKMHNSHSIRSILEVYRAESPSLRRLWRHYKKNMEFKFDEDLSMYLTKLKPESEHFIFFFFRTNPNSIVICQFAGLLQLYLSVTKPKVTPPMIKPIKRRLFKQFPGRATFSYKEITNILWEELCTCGEPEQKVPIKIVDLGIRELFLKESKPAHLAMGIRPKECYYFGTMDPLSFNNVSFFSYRFFFHSASLLALRATPNQVQEQAKSIQWKVEMVDLSSELDTTNQISLGSRVGIKPLERLFLQRGTKIEIGRPGLLYQVDCISRPPLPSQKFPFRPLILLSPPKRASLPPMIAKPTSELILHPLQEDVQPIEMTLGMHGKVILGSGPDADFKLDKSSVSNKHCSVRYEGDALWLRDEGSRNGTWVLLPRDEWVSAQHHHHHVSVGHLWGLKLINL